MTPEEQAALVLQQEADAKAKIEADKRLADEAEKTAPKLFTQADVNRFVKNEREKSERDAQSKIETEKKAADEARLKEQGEYKLIAESKERELDTLKANIEAANLETMRVKAAAKFKLDEKMARRLVGTTQEELEKDAEELSKSIAPAMPPNLQNGMGYNGNGGRLTEKQAAEVTEVSLRGTGRYNV